MDVNGAVFATRSAMHTGVLVRDPMTTILTKPGCRHRAVGKMRIVNIPIPAFDPADEWFD